MTSEELYRDEYDIINDTYFSIDKVKTEREAPWKLITEIIKRSEAATWHEAKKEWHFSGATFAPLGDMRTCLCGHTPIVELYHLDNVYNHQAVIVGNVCVNKFMDIEEDVKKIIPCLLRVKEKLSKSLNSETLELAIAKDLLTEWEHDFYWDTLGKRKLSLKQENVRKRINKKVLNNLIKH